MKNTTHEKQTKQQKKKQHKPKENKTNKEIKHTKLIPSDAVIAIRSPNLGTNQRMIKP
jgi:hypothetical protein